MKDNKILATAVAAIIGASVATADISLSDNLTLSGFVDASYSNSDDGTTNNESIGLDQVEVDFAFSGESVSAEVHLDSLGRCYRLRQHSSGTSFLLITTSATVSLYQVVRCSISSVSSLTSLPVATKAPTHIPSDSAAVTSGETGRRYAEGLRASFGVEDVAIAVSGYNGLYSGKATDMDLAYDAQVVFSGVENLTVALGYAEDDNSASIAEAVNVWASYESGQVMIAGEYNDVTDGAGNEGDSYLLLANYQINDNASISVRYSEQDLDGTANDVEKFSIAPIYNFTDNLSAFVEYSTGEVDGTDNDSFSIETVFTF